MPVSGEETSKYWNEASELIASGKSGQAINLCQQEPHSSVLQCQIYLGWEFYKRGDLEKALTWFEKAASIFEDGEALFGIASVYFTEKNFPMALQYFERSAERSYGRAYYWVADMYQYGVGAAVDVDQAIHFYQKGMESGYLMAERCLIFLAYQNEGLIGKGMSMFRLFFLLLKATKMACRNINDPRLADIRKWPTGMH